MGFKVKKKKKTKFRSPSSFANGVVGTAGGGAGEVPSNSSGTHRNRSKRGGGKGLVIILALLSVVLVIVAVTAFFGYREISGKRGMNTADIVVTVPEGSSTSAVADVLVQNGIIKNVTAFKAYSRFKKADGTYQFGDHTLNSSLSYDEIIEVLQQMTVKDIEMYPPMTFPEGRTTLGMAYDFEEAGICTANEFVDICNNDTFTNDFLKEITYTGLEFIKLEGFLFPDTYTFEKGISVHDMIQQMLDNYEKNIYTDAFKAQVASSGYTLKEVMTLASIVEKESFGGEQYNVAAAFHNRMQDKERFPRLQSDTSAEKIPGNFIWGVIGLYYNGSIEPVTGKAPQEMIDAYDTYKVDGIIVAPICNPGFASIDAVLNPADTPYFFFITDQNKKFYWAETDAQHSKNIKTVEAVNKALADGTFDANKDYSA
ncbi:MAG: endolytic transglycosylase MltG [Oscillospiraceae bacterium]